MLHTIFNIDIKETTFQGRLFRMMTNSELKFKMKKSLIKKTASSLEKFPKGVKKLHDSVAN